MRPSAQLEVPASGLTHPHVVVEITLLLGIGIERVDTDQEAVGAGEQARQQPAGRTSLEGADLEKTLSRPPGEIAEVLQPMLLMHGEPVLGEPHRSKIQ